MRSAHCAGCRVKLQSRVIPKYIDLLAAGAITEFTGWAARHHDKIGYRQSHCIGTKTFADDAFDPVADNGTAIDFTRNRQADPRQTSDRCRLGLGQAMQHKAGITDPSAMLEHLLELIGAAQSLAGSQTQRVTDP